MIIPLICVGIVVVAGCSRQDDYPSMRLGSVTVDGQPIPEGSIELVPTGSNQGRGTSGNIENGHYLIEKAPLGNVLVMLTANRDTAQATFRV